MWSSLTKLLLLSIAVGLLLLSCVAPYLLLLWGQQFWIRIPPKKSQNDKNKVVHVYSSVFILQAYLDLALKNKKNRIRKNSKFWAVKIWQMANSRNDTRLKIQIIDAESNI